MPNIPKLRLMLARMEKTASRWRTLQGLTALLGKDVVAATPRIGALQLAAKQQGIKLPGEGFAKAMSSLPEGPIGASASLKPSPGTLAPTQVFRGGSQPADLIRGGYSTDYIHATPFKHTATDYGHIDNTLPVLALRHSERKLGFTPPTGGNTLVGVYGTTKNQRYMPDFGFERDRTQLMGNDRIDPTRGLSYAYRMWQDSNLRKNFIKNFSHLGDDQTGRLSRRYETLVKPSQLQSVLLNDRVLPATAKGRELLQTGTMPAGATLPSEILKSAGLADIARLEKEAAVTKEELIHAYKANDPAMRILSQSPVTDKDFLYHASGKKFNALDPKYNSKRSYGHEYTEPVVFAGDAPSSAFASNPTAEYQAVKDKMKDSVYHRLIDELTGRKALLGHTPGGYLYKLPASAFTRIDREDNELGKWNKSTEYVSHRPVKPVSVTPMQSTDVDAIPEYEYLGKDFVGEMPAQHYLKHAKNPKVIAAIQAWLANKEKSAAAMNLYSYIPNGSIEHVKKHGLLSGNELAKPENRHLLNIARPDGDADRWLKERDARLAKSPWTNSYNGPSAFFGDIDAGKIHDKHPIKKFETTRAVIKLRELLRDYPATKMEGSELIPFSNTTYDALDEKGRNEFVNKRHHTLSLDEIKALLTRGQNPKDMWKDFKDTEGKYYASDVPHAQVVTPMGKIPSKYIKFGEADMGKDAVGFSVPDDVLTKHANLARLGMAAAKGLYGLGSAAVKSPIAQNIATGASNLVNRAGNLANTAIQSPMAQNIATRAGNLANSAMQSRVGKTLITGAEKLHSGTVDLANRAIQNPIVSRLYAGANDLTNAAIQSPMTPDFIKNTFKPGYEAGRQALRRTSRQWVPNWDAQAGFVPIPKRPSYHGKNSIHNSPDRVFRKYKAVNTPQLPPSTDGGYWNRLDQIAVDHPRGTESGMRVMRHELTHGLQHQLPSNFNSLQTASVNSPFAGSFLREMNANAAMSRTPLGQMGRAIGYATSPDRLKAYWNGYKPIDKLMHGAAIGTAYGVPIAAGLTAGGVGAYEGLHSIAKRMQPTDLPHTPEFAQAGPPNLNTEESFPEEVA